MQQFLGKPLPHKCRCVTLHKGDRILGIGGIATVPEHGLFVAFAHLDPEARRYPVALHRAGLISMAAARRMGARRVHATADPTVPAAERWLKRHGFSHVGIAPDGHKVFICSV